MSRVTMSIPNEEHKALKVMALLSGKSMSKLFSDWIRRNMKTKKIEDISELGKRLLAMPIEEGDEFDKEMLKGTVNIQNEPDVGTLKDLQKELGLDQHAT